MTRKRIYQVPLLLCLVLFIFCPFCFANNLTITNVSFKDRDPANDTITVNFNVSWENSWKSKINHDAAWLTVRLYNPSISPTDKRLCQMSKNGLNPSGMSAGSNTNFEIFVPNDKRGVFLRSVKYGTYSSVSSNEVQLKVNYASCGFTDSDQAFVSVFGVEMVYIPQGSFYVGDRDTSTASLDQGSSDTDPWYISSESALSVTNPTSDGFRYVSNGNNGEDATGTAFTILDTFPKGYAPFYVMKYEITEAQWVEFINSLPSNQARSQRDVTDSSHKNSDSVMYRNTVSCSGSPMTCTTERPSRTMSYLSWMDVAAFLDWAALRPLTELEFEKVARGPLLPIEGEFAWGTTNITAATTISGINEDGTETISNNSANCQFNNTTLSGGDSANGAEYQKGPLRVGIFAINSSDREQSGASYYGVMELSGNVVERVVTIGNSAGRNFIGSHGDGILSISPGYEGNANQSDWPGMDAITSRGITGALGAGYRGGAWDSQDSGIRLRISDRYEAANASILSFSDSGGRGARTYDGN